MSSTSVTQVNVVHVKGDNLPLMFSWVFLGPRVEEAMYRSIRWLDRCIKGHKRKEHQNLFPIIQGGLNLDWRTTCVKGIKSRISGHNRGQLISVFPPLFTNHRLQDYLI